IGNEAFIPPEQVASLPDPKPVTIGGQTLFFEGIDAVYGANASFGMLGTPFETFGDATDHLVGQSYNVTFNVRNGRTVNIPQVVFDPRRQPCSARPSPRTTPWEQAMRGSTRSWIRSCSWTVALRWARASILAARAPWKSI